ncbi:MAG: formylglycine-generating enzyme family protein [Nitrospinaceae bacterium]
MTGNIPLKFGAVLVILLVWAPPGGAREKHTPPEKVPGALKMLVEKKEWDQKQLKRLSERILIPTGEFIMGFARGRKNEQPAHRVVLGAFYMDKYEVTQLQYQSVMGQNPSYFKKCPLCPVEWVTWEQARTYCGKVNKRLPTEAEWEKAAKGGVNDSFYWDGDHPDDFAWYGDNSERRTHPVGGKKPNGYGLHDMAGNVWEWVSDWYDGDYYQISPRANPQGPAREIERVSRGGGWGYSPELLRHSYRESHFPDTRYILGGFRCASDVETK